MCFLNLVEFNQIWILIYLFRLIWNQTEFRMEPNQSQKYIYYPNLFLFKIIQKRFLCVQGSGTAANISLIFEPNFPAEVDFYSSGAPIRAPTTETRYKGFAKYAVDANLFRLGSSNPKTCGFGGAAPVEGEASHNFFY